MRRNLIVQIPCWDNYVLDLPNPCRPRSDGRASQRIHVVGTCEFSHLLSKSKRRSDVKRFLNYKATRRMVRIWAVSSAKRIAVVLWMFLCNSTSMVDHDMCGRALNISRDACREPWCFQSHKHKSMWCIFRNNEESILWLSLRKVCNPATYVLLLLLQLSSSTKAPHNTGSFP
jgi:hypothetical protein